MRSLRTTDFDRIASSAPLNATASVVRDSPGEHWTPQAKDDRIRSDVPIPCAPLPHGAPDLTGWRTGRLVIIGYHSRRKKNGRMWVVRCLCGAYEVRRGDRLAAQRSPELRELMCMDCEALIDARDRAHAAATGRWPGGKPANITPGLNVQGGGKTLKDLGVLSARQNHGARR